MSGKVFYDGQKISSTYQSTITSADGKLTFPNKATQYNDGSIYLGQLRDKKYYNGIANLKPNCEDEFTWRYKPDTNLVGQFPPAQVPAGLVDAFTPPRGLEMEQYLGYKSKLAPTLQETRYTGSNLWSGVDAKEVVNWPTEHRANGPKMYGAYPKSAAPRNFRRSRI
jgi:hypothetical protein